MKFEAVYVPVTKVEGLGVIYRQFDLPREAGAIEVAEAFPKKGPNPLGFIDPGSGNLYEARIKRLVELTPPDGTPRLVKEW